MGFAAACLLLTWPPSAAAYVGILPPTLGELCRQATHISVLRVEKVNAEKGVILFKSVEQLKATGKLPLPDAAKQVIGPNVSGAKVILDGAAEGKTAILFAKSFELKAVAHVYIDGYWYLVGRSLNADCWHAAQGEPTMLMRYCGAADKLGEALPKLLRGEEIVVPAMVSDNLRDLEQRRARVQDVRASLRLLGNPKQNLERDLKFDGKTSGLDGKKPVPEDKKPEGKKGEERKPDLVGTVKAISGDGKRFTLMRPPMEKNKEPTPVEILLGENVKIIDGKLAVGQSVSVWLGKGDVKIAMGIRIGNQAENPKKKPMPEDGKAPDRKPDRVGTLKTLGADGKSLTLQPAPNEKNKEPAPIEILIGEGARILDGKEPGKLKVGQTVNLWFAKGNDSLAVEIRIRELPDAPEKKPTEKKPEGKPAPKENDKPEAPKKPKEPAEPVRDPAPTASVIDAEVNRRLAEIKVPASPRADDAEFLRRVTLDLTGRIPTYQQTVSFLDSKDPDKRRKLIDELLDSPAYGEHFAAVWRSRLVPRELNVNGKGGNSHGAFGPWLAEQFNDNRGWNAIVAEMLTATGTPADNPAAAFLLANGENSQPQPNKAAGAVAALFLGVNLRCAECHNHPFAPWKQKDFWGTAAFFGKVQYSGAKGEQPSLGESLPGTPRSGKEKGQSAQVVRGAAIAIPATSGKAAGQVVKARFLGGDEPALDEQEPFRPRFAAWATAGDNPYFARAAVNRMWAHFFGRGFVNPLDGFDENNPPSHPELLERLTKEFIASGFDLKHLARCITTSKTYQRTNRPAPGNEDDAVGFSHMAVKVLTPEVLFDALETFSKSSGGSGKGSGKGSGESREQFLHSFRIEEDATATEYIQGIPQLLRMMNASTPNRGAAIVEKLVSSKASRTEAVETLYLTALSRRPSAEEVKLMSEYLSRRQDDREGYRGVLWILLNSSEFALNR
jgi:hypothetical protein